MLDRDKHRLFVARLLKQHPAVALLGARQVGKTTLARELFAASKQGTWFDCEDPRDLARLENPMLALEGLRGLVVIDEIQRRPELFPSLRVLVDRRPLRARFLLLGSASGDLLHQSSESLAGRIAYHELSGFNLGEVGPNRLADLWLRGGFPRSFTARTLSTSASWRREFIRTFLERDLAQLGLRIASKSLERFWTMLAHLHGQLLNWSELGRSMSVNDNTVRGYCDALEQTFMVRQLRPWHENLRKRVVKSPKLYLRDSGLLHSLLDIGNRRELERHPKLGASFEGFAIEQITQHLGARDNECFFWRTHSGAELDLLIVRGGERLGFEVKYTDSPKVTPSMRNAQADLKLERIEVLHAGAESFELAPRIRARSIRELC